MILIPQTPKEWYLSQRRLDLFDQKFPQKILIKSQEYSHNYYIKF